MDKEINNELGQKMFSQIVKEEVNNASNDENSLHLSMPLPSIGENTYASNLRSNIISVFALRYFYTAFVEKTDHDGDKIIFQQFCNKNIYIAGIIKSDFFNSELTAIYVFQGDDAKIKKYKEIITDIFSNTRNENTLQN